MSKKLSLIIVNYNSGHFLSECLESIRKCNFPKEDYEILVIDNNSSDDSLQRIDKNFVKIIKNKTNLGFSKANNLGISVSSGDYILFLNPDTLLPEGLLSYLLNYMKQNTHVAVVTCRLELSDGSLDDACHRGFPTPWNSFCYFSGLAKLFPHSNFLNGYHLGYRNLNIRHEIESCVGAFMLVNRKAGQSVGWLDEDYFWYGEDLDFCFRLKQKGWKIIYDPSYTVIHFKGVSSGLKSHSQNITTASKKVRQLSTQARFDVMSIFYKKHYLKKYPLIVTALVLFGISLSRKISEQRIKYL